MATGMTRPILVTVVRGLVGLAACFGFGWSLSNTAAALTRHMDKTPMRQYEFDRSEPQ